MTPKARREQQLNREDAKRSDTEASISGFKSGKQVRRSTVLTSTKKTRKFATRCYGCDAGGQRIEVFEYVDVEAGPSILCEECARAAESVYRSTRAPRPAFPARPTAYKQVRSRSTR